MYGKGESAGAELPLSIQGLKGPITFCTPKSLINTALQSLNTRSVIEHFKLQDLMTPTPVWRKAIPVAPSVWVDFPNRGIPSDHRALLQGITQVSALCAQFKVPFIIIKPIDYALCKQPEWVTFVTNVQAHFHTICSCFLPDCICSNNHWRKEVAIAHFGGPKFNSHCRKAQYMKVHTNDAQRFWINFYQGLIRFLSGNQKGNLVVNRIPDGPRHVNLNHGGPSKGITPNTPTFRIRQRSRGTVFHVSVPSLEGAPTAILEDTTTGSSQCLPDFKACPEQAPIHTTSYPTDSRERRKAREKAAKEAGTPLVVVKQKKFIEEHYDDCGEDLSGLMLDNEEDEVVANYTSTFLCNPDFTHYHDYADKSEVFIEDKLASIMFYGSINTIGTMSPLIYIASSIEELCFVANQRGKGIDIAEICGGEAKATQLGIRRKLTHGPNFDLVTGCDLSDPKQENDCIRYFAESDVLVAVMAPACGPFGPMSHLNWHLHPKTMQQSYAKAKPLARVCGKVAHIQLLKGNEFILEQPNPSALFAEYPWPTVFRDFPKVVQVPYDRCMCGLRVIKGPHKYKHIRKPSTMTVSCAELGCPFTNLICDGQHEHLQDIGHGQELRDAQVWTWVEASKIIQGVVEVRECHKRGYSIYESAYVQFDRSKVDTPGYIPKAHVKVEGQSLPTPPSKRKAKCKGCSNSRPKDDWTHTREIGDCTYPFDNPTIWKCDACMEHKQRDVTGIKGHTGIPGECRWQGIAHRQSAHRLQSHPRTPNVRAHQEIGARLPGTSSEGELGHQIESEAEEAAIRQIDEIDRRAKKQDASAGAERPDSGTSSSSTAPPPADRPFDPKNLAHRPYGPRTKWSTTGSGTENAKDWTGFDLARVLQVLRTAEPNACRLTLRKLHLRWWHAQTGPLQRLLSRAGVSKQVLDLIPEIVDTCVACRTWAKPLPDAQASVEICDQFNAQVECDLLFISGKVIFHLIDRCTRWHHALVIPSKHGPELVKGIDSWYTIHGGMQELIVDGERGIVIAEGTVDYCKRKGIKIQQRAVGQHARIIERRGALVRDSIHRIDEQLNIEGIVCSFAERLSEVVFAGNALISINNTTPYNAVYGRTPALLPGMEMLNSEGEITPITNRQVGRVREICVQQMIEGVARNKLVRAIQTRTLPAGEQMELQPGDEVEVFRPAATKDTSGWLGPAKVTDVKSIHHGIIKVKHVGAEMVCRCGDVRKVLQYICFHSNYFYEGFQPGNSHASAWTHIRSFLELLPPNTSVRLGWHRVDNKWHLTPQTNQHGKVFDACMYFVENSLYRHDVFGIRIGKGIGKLAAVPDCDSSLVMYWSDRLWTKQYIELECPQNVCPQVNLQRLRPNEWSSLRVIQTLEFSETVAVTTHTDQAVSTSHDDDDRDFQPPSGNLSTIDEGTEESVESLFSHEDPILHEALQDAKFLSELLEPAEEEDQVHNHLYDQIHDPCNEPCYYNNEQSGGSASSTAPIKHYHVVAANLRHGLPWDHKLDDQDDFVEIYYTGDTWKLLDDVHTAPREGEVVVLRIYHSEQVKRSVVVKDDDTLTKEEMIKFSAEVEAAMLQELQTWAKYKCFSRKMRKHARNVIDSRWVIKWKWDQDTQSVDESNQTKAVARKVIRARLTVRGFKDIEKHLIDRYAGTAQRYSQRCLASEAVVRKWDIATTDISKAFLQGVTYKELAEITGEPLREVNFYLPSANTHLLNQVEGFSGFNPQTEVLHCDKPGTGSVDAPRCFSMKLSVCTKKECGMTDSSIDAELCMLHVERNGQKELVCLMTKHVDDLKVTGERSWIEFVLKKIQETFGNLKIVWNSFTNCGVCHDQNKITKELTLDQIEYGKQLRIIAHSDLKTMKNDEFCGHELHALYMSLVGAVAYMYLTRLDVLVYISAKQRHSHKPKIEHVKSLNKLIRYVQAHPKKLAYRNMKQGPTHLRVVSDAAFKKEEEKGHALRGALYLRAEGHLAHSHITNSVIHVLEFQTKAIRHVTRSTFAAELHSACDSADLGLLVLLILHEFHSGEVTKAQARHLRTYGGYSINMSMQIDAMSVFAAVTATFIKHPAEKGLLSHVQFLRELLDSHVLGSLLWVDTRDMLSDGMTKGAVDRAALHEVMSGVQRIVHAVKAWSSKIALKNAPPKLSEDIAA